MEKKKGPRSPKAQAGLGSHLHTIRKAVDASHEGGDTVNQDETKAIHELFAKYDIDGSGHLAVDEFVHIYADMKHELEDLEHAEEKIDWQKKVIMFFGVLLIFILALAIVGGVVAIEATRQEYVTGTAGTAELKDSKGKVITTSSATVTFKDLSVDWNESRRRRRRRRLHQADSDVTMFCNVSSDQTLPWSDILSANIEAVYDTCNNAGLTCTADSEVESAYCTISDDQTDASVAVIDACSAYGETDCNNNSGVCQWIVSTYNMECVEERCKTTCCNDDDCVEDADATGCSNVCSWESAAPHHFSNGCDAWWCYTFSFADDSAYEACTAASSNDPEVTGLIQIPCELMVADGEDCDDDDVQFSVSMVFGSSSKCDSLKAYVDEGTGGGFTESTWATLSYDLSAVPVRLSYYGDCQEGETSCRLHAYKCEEKFSTQADEDAFYAANGDKGPCEMEVFPYNDVTAQSRRRLNDLLSHIAEDHALGKGSSRPQMKHPHEMPEGMAAWYGHIEL